VVNFTLRPFYFQRFTPVYFEKEAWWAQERYGEEKNLLPTDSRIPALAGRSFVTMPTELPQLSTIPRKVLWPQSVVAAHCKLNL
jgi:hypothetical protein